MYKPWEIRFIDEYKELKDKYNKLVAMLERWKNDELDFTPHCPFELLQEQAQVMKRYLEILEERADIEAIRDFK